MALQIFLRDRSTIVSFLHMRESILTRDFSCVMSDSARQLRLVTVVHEELLKCKGIDTEALSIY